MIININQLRSFYFTAKQGGVSKAAQELMVTPPAVTMQIKQLEETLGLGLMYREGNQVSLTEIGQEVYQRSRRIFELIRDMEVYLSDLAAARTGELRIACPQTPARYLLPGLISRFKAQYPEIKIVIDTGSAREVTLKVLRDQSDLAWVRHRSEDRRLKVRYLGTEELVLFAATKTRLLNSDQISADGLSALPLVVTRAGSAVREVVFEYLARLRVKPRLAMESANIDVIKEFVGRDQGVAFMERFAVQDELTSGVFREIGILEGGPSISYGLGYRQRRLLSPAAWAFLRLLDKQENSPTADSRPGRPVPDRASPERLNGD